MANLFIGDISDDLLKQLKMLVAQEGITLKQLVVPLLEHAVNSTPLVYKVVSSEPTHNLRVSRDSSGGGYDFTVEPQKKVRKP